MQESLMQERCFRAKTLFGKHGSNMKEKKLKHPHHDLIVEWVNDTRRVVQWRRGPMAWEDIDPDVEPITWAPTTQYRFKPEPKPDVVCEAVFGIYPSGHLCYHVSSAAKPNLRLTFDGETRRLKSAEVL